jgi:uncharacterized membrane protein
MAYALALGSALLYGLADFLGGLAVMRTTTVAAVLVSQFTGLVLLLLLLPILPVASPGHADLLWGGAAGFGGGVGVALLYRALAIGPMAIVAPITAVCAVAIPVIAAVALGERPAPLALVGIVLAVVAIVLVSQQRQAAPDTHTRSPASSAVSLALLAGVAIGFFFFALARAGSNAGLWPLGAARVVGVLLFAAIALTTSASLRMDRRTLLIVVVSGAIDMTANALYLIATWGAPLSVVVTLSSLYPASTIMLARVVLAERLSPWQTAGVGCALTAVVLIVSAP